MTTILDLWNTGDGYDFRSVDDIPPSIKLFSNMISELWTKKIEQNTCISRKYRNIIRIVIRDFMASYPKMDEDKKSPINAPMQWVTDYYIKKNSYRNAMMEYNNKYLQNLYNSITLLNINTVGEFILFNVFNLLNARNSDKTPYLYDTQITDNDDSIRETFVTTCVKIFTDQLNIINMHNNKYLFVTVPMYLWYNVSPLEVQQKLKDLKLFKNNIGLTIYGFFMYMGKISRYLTTSYKLILSYLGEKWEFGRSVSETILYGLGYTVFDNLYAYTNQYIDVYFSMRENVIGGYNFAIYYIRGNILLPINESDIPIEYRSYAIKIATSNYDDTRFAYFSNRNYLLTMDDCTKIEAIPSESTNDGHHLDKYIHRDYGNEDEQHLGNEDEQHLGNNSYDNIKPTPILKPMPRPPFPRQYDYINERSILLPIPKTNPNGTYIERMEINNKIIDILDNNLNRLGSYCCDHDSVNRLQNHIETLGQYSLILARKVNIQSLLIPWPLVKINHHSINGTIPPH
ncbi:p4c precursor [Yokapox virus]|uniref:p4c n=1 Tax=Yokapox virus TaxID=1076255 RepID=G3EI22_9POXV|nr:p4c precursor [Yokapox virus]AEN03719.1 p4c precursor [Yokapox virus]